MIKDIFISNKIFRFDCFLFALKCAIENLGGDYIPLLLNEYHLYEQGREYPKIRRKKYVALEELQQYLGVGIKKMSVSENVLQQIRERLNKSELVIVVTNDYYNPLRLDMCGVQHKPHHILIYDMDWNNQTIKIVESKYRKSVFYEKMDISFQNFLEAQKYTDSKEIIIVYKEEKNKNKIDNLFTSKQTKGNIEMRESIECLKTYSLLLRDVLCLENQNHWIEFLNDMCNQFQLYTFVCNQVYPDRKLRDSVEEIYRKYYLLRVRFLKDLKTDFLISNNSYYSTIFEEIEKKEYERIGKWKCLDVVKYQLS